MIDQVLQQIKICEEQAAKIRLDAEESRQARIKEGEQKAASIMLDAQARLQESKRQHKQDLLVECDALYKGIVEDAKNQADALYKNASVNTEELAQDIVKGIINGNCWNVAHEACGY